MKVLMPCGGSGGLPTALASKQAVYTSKSSNKRVATYGEPAAIVSDGARLAGYSLEQVNRSSGAKRHV